MVLKHSEILARLLKLQSMNYEYSTSSIKHYMEEVSKMLAGAEHQDVGISEVASKLEAALNSYQSVVNTFASNLKSVIESHVPSYLERSEQLYRDNIEKMTFDENVKWAALWPPTGKELDDFVLQCGAHSIWSSPGLVFGTKHRPEILATVSSSDPIYIVERYRDYFPFQKNLVDPDTARKFRCYPLDDIPILPKNSIGTVVIYNEFPFLPWNIIAVLMNDFIETICPGGYFIFNINDCNTVKGLSHFEKGLMTYTTADMFKKYLGKRGFQHLKTYHSTVENFSYLVFQKEGVRSNIKKNPALGYIRNKPLIPNSPDIRRDKIDYIRKVMSSK